MECELKFLNSDKEQAKELAEEIYTLFSVSRCSGDTAQMATYLAIISLTGMTSSTKEMHIRKLSLFCAGLLSLASKEDIEE